MIETESGRHFPDVPSSPASPNRPADDDVSIARTLEQPPADLEGRLISNNVHARLFGESAPTRIGKYMILRRLGGGAMGDVYLGWHEDLERCDAIKLVRPSAEHDAGEQRRLLREAQALARLADDHVVRVHDSGTHDGRVYLAMEYVKGTTLAVWQKHRPWRAILGAYVQAGRGLLVAHRVALDDHERPGLRPAVRERRGLVHRDFKPENVLVGDDGRVQVADFGLAVPLTRDEPGAAAGPGTSRLGLHLTGETSLVGTPLYISPEQLAHRPADARSDQYSFCVALYEALYGQHPFYDPASAARGSELPTDSHGPGVTAPAHIALFESILRGQLRPPPRGPVPRRIHGVLARGLRRDPAARYPSMAELLADLEPRPVRRLLWLVGPPLAAVATFLAMQGPPGFCRDIEQEVAGLWDDERSTRVHDAFLATAAPYAATSHALVDARIRAYLGDWTAARQAACDSTYVSGTWDRELHARSMACLQQHLGLASAAIDELERIDAGSIAGAVDRLEALPALTDCRSDNLLRQTCAHEPGDPETAQVRARITRAQAAEQAGRYTEAEPLAAAAVAAAEAHALPAQIVDARFTHGRTLTELGRPAPALAALTAARDEAERAACDVEVGDIDSYITKLIGLSPTLDPRVGLVYANDSLLKQDRTGLEDPQRAATTIGDRGLIHERHERDYEAAEADYRAALALRGETDETRGARAIHHLNLGSVLRRQGRLGEAITEYQRSLELYTAVYGADHPRLFKPLFNLGAAATEANQIELAEQCLTRALALAQASLGDPDVRDTHAALASLYIDQEDGERAHRHAGLAVALCERQGSPGQPECLDPLRLLAYSHRRLGRSRQALEVRERVLAATQKAGGPDLAGAHLELAESLIDAGNWAQALRHIDAARPGFADDDPVSLDVLLYTGEALLGLEAPGQAVEPLERALARSDHPAQRARVAWALARSLCAAGGDSETARQLARSAREFHALGSDDPAAAKSIAEIDLWSKQHCNHDR